MSNPQKLQSPLKTKYTLITDPKVLELIKKEEEEALAKGQEALYIASNETEETFDQEIISGQGHDLQKSSAEVGQLRPIEVAIWFDDPNKDKPNSTLRIHRRIINGRHRYKSDPTWRREYYDFSGFATQDDKLAPVVEYNLAKGHFDMQKKATKAERTVWVNNMCVLAMKKGIEMIKVCQWVVNKADKEGISSKNSIRDVCEDKYKDPEHVLSKKGHTFEKSGRDTQEVKKLKKVAGEKFQTMEAEKNKFETENHQLQKEILGLRDDNTKKTNDMEELQAKIRVLSNIEHEHKCDCGIISKVKVDTTSGKFIFSKKK